MKLFDPLYKRVMSWAAHKHAPWYLCLVSFMESSFFPIPTVFMLIPMVAATPKRGWYLAALTTISSVAGGLLGYLIGFAFIEAVMPWIMEFGYLDKYELAQDWFTRWGFWALFLAGVSPIPYKIFTIAGGSMAMHLLPFVLASIVGRAIQFFLAASLVIFLGPKFLPMVERYVERIGWAVVVIVAVALAIKSLV